jgi:serine/threonine protein kinase
MLTKDKVLKGRYRIVDSLGESETGTVYEAYDSIRKANVALKEILIDSEKVPAISEREILKRAFADRAKILAEVKHESLPQIRGYFSEFDRQYLVMELINGDDASDLMAKNEKPLLFSDVANWADQLLDALDYLHTLVPPLVHGDIKPQNVKLNSRGKIKLLGFDIIESKDAKINTIVTNQAAVSAALPYSPLEQILRTVNLAAGKVTTEVYGDKLENALKKTTDARSDVYALGATLYYLVTAQIPVDALERTIAVWSEEFDPLPSSSELNSAIPIEFSDVLAKAMEIEPEKRFGSAMEMRQALQTAVVRAQERVAEESKKREAAAARETLLAEEKHLEQERQLVGQERLRLEAERNQQAELLERQLKTAETERLKAEQRAADAEKQLSEKKTANAGDKMPSPVLENASEDSARKFHNATAYRVADARKTVSNEPTTLFAEPQSDKKSSWLIPVIVVGFLVVGGAAGIWSLRSPNVAAESKQSTTNQTVSATDKPTSEPVTETVPQPMAEKISTDGTMPALSSSPVSIEKSVSQPAFKNKPVLPPAKIEKTAPKPAANRKKAITVDDIIGGN